MIKSPHNPTGSTLSREDLLQLQALVERHDLLVISDEVFADLTHPGGDHLVPGLQAGQHNPFIVHRDGNPLDGHI